MIRCARGETILLIHDTTLPRPYSRALRVQGSRGLYMEDTQSVHIEGKTEHEKWDSIESYRETYEHPLWKSYLAEGVRGGHDGMDYLVLRSFVENAKAQAVPPIDVYDAAAWMAVTCLSEESVALGGAPVCFPDFTGGKWIGGTAGGTGRYAL